jgi:hypothetical protein
MGRNTAGATAARRVQIHAHVEPDVHRGLVAVARENDRSLAAEIRRALAVHLERQQQEGD